MKNILYKLGTKQFFDNEMIDNINKELGVTNSYVIVGFEQEMELFSNSKCILRDDAVLEKLDKYKFFGNEHEMLPIDDALLNQINPEMLEIIRTQQRFQEKEKFRTTGDLDRHYRVLMENLKFWNDLLEMGGITEVVFTDVPHEGYDSIIYHLCKIKNISIHIIYWSTLPNRCVIVEDYKELGTKLAREYEKLKIKYKNAREEEILLEDESNSHFEYMCAINQKIENKEYERKSSFADCFGDHFGIISFRQRFEWSCRVKYGAERERHPKFHKILIKAIVACKSIPELCSYTPAILYGKKMFKKSRELHNEYQKIAQLPKSENYVFFAMHYVPEATSAPLGGGLYFDQYLPIAIISKAVPKDWKVYVKIHPTQSTNRFSWDDIEKIRRLKNTVLIDESVKTTDLIKNAKAVSTLTGSVAWESQFYNIPALCFGYSEKSAAPLSYFVRTIEDCENAINDIINNKKTTSKAELKLFVKAMKNISFEKSKKEIEKQMLLAKQ